MDKEEVEEHCVKDNLINASTRFVMARAAFENAKKVMDRCEKDYEDWKKRTVNNE